MRQLEKRSTVSFSVFIDTELNEENKSTVHIGNIALNLRLTNSELNHFVVRDVLMHNNEAQFRCFVDEKYMIINFSFSPHIIITHYLKKTYRKSLSKVFALEIHVYRTLCIDSGIVLTILHRQRMIYPCSFARGRRNSAVASSLLWRGQYQAKAKDSG